MVRELVENDVLVSAVIAWAIAQFLKVITHRINAGLFDLRLWTSSGGMPSSHSAFVTALATAVGMVEGVETPLFAVTAVLSIIVMYDATGIRRAASHQARILNHIVGQLFAGHPISEEKLKELLGHTPVQVFAGALLGIGVAWWWITSQAL